MILDKNSEPITSLSDWALRGKPKSATHWVPERSAFEAAREWLDVTSPALPAGIQELLKSNAAFGDVVKWSAEPEVQIRIDGFRGEPRNCDLLVSARDTFGEFVIAVEAKADEPFGETVGDTFAAALERLVASPSSKGVERITNLAQSLFTARSTGTSKIADLRYQLLTATAGAIAAAKAGGRTVMLIQEFRTGKTHPDKHSANASDLDAFLHRLTRGAVAKCESGKLYGPIDLSRSSEGEGAGASPQLFIGKIVHDRTKMTADEGVRLAMLALGGERNADEVKAWIEQNLTQRWKDIGTTMADMTPSLNSVTGYDPDRQILERIAPGVYRLQH